VLQHAPTSVRLSFNEPVEPVGRGVRVVGPSGRRVDRGPVRVVGADVLVKIDAVEEGTYVVTWRVIAGDTHPAQGAYAFSVGHASERPGQASPAAGSLAGARTGLILQMAARALHFAGYALSFGVLAFRQAVLHPLSLTAEPPVERRVWRLVTVGILVLLSAEPFALLAQTASLGAGGGGPLDLEVVGGALESSFGRVLGQRLGAAVLLWALVGAVASAPARVTGAALLLGLGVAFVDGEAAHAAGTRWPWLGLGLNTAHVAAMGTWVGGVLALLGVWRLPAVTGYRSRVALRFGRVAALSLAVLAATGAGMAVQHLAGPADLATTAYGRTLAAKLGALLVAVVLAFAAAKASPGHREGWWVWEAVTLLGILALAGLLVSLLPPV
jgi:copper transport protein